MSHLRRISSELSCLSSGLPRALLRSLFNSSTDRRYSTWSSPAGYVAVTNFESGLTRSTSDDFFNGTEIKVAISARIKRQQIGEEGNSLSIGQKQLQFHFLYSAVKRQMTLAHRCAGAEQMTEQRLNFNVNTYTIQYLIVLLVSHKYWCGCSKKVL